MYALLCAFAWGWSDAFSICLLEELGGITLENQSFIVYLKSRGAKEADVKWTEARLPD